MGGFIQLLISGLVWGMLYGLIALSFTLIFNSTRLVNFTQGDFAMLAAMGSALLLIHIGASFAFILLLIGVALVGAGVYWLVVRHFLARRAAGIVGIMSTIGVSMILTQCIIIGVTPFNIAVPTLSPVNIFQYAGITFNIQGLVVIGAGGVIALLVWLFLNKTRIGLAIRAVGYNEDAARLMGIDVSFMRLITFVISSAIAAAIGFLAAPITTAYATMGMSLTVNGFIAAVIGGLGHPFFSLIGGIILGLLTSFSAFYISTYYASLIAFAVLILFLIFCPNGVFNVSEEY